MGEGFSRRSPKKSSAYLVFGREERVEVVMFRETVRSFRQRDEASPGSPTGPTAEAASFFVCESSEELDGLHREAFGGPAPASLGPLIACRSRAPLIP